MQKRQPRASVNAQGDHIGGQFACSERAKDLVTSISSSPYPTKKRQVTVKIPAYQTNIRPLSKAPAVRVKKDPSTGFWEAETPYCNPQSGYAMEKLRGGLTGDESEIAGYYARTAVALCNAGLIDISDKEHMSWVQAGVSSAGACLELPGNWSTWTGNTRSKRANDIKRMYRGLVKFKNDKHHPRYDDFVRMMMLYTAKVRDIDFFDGSPLSIERGYGPLEELRRYQGHCYKEVDASPPVEISMLVWAVAFQHAAQNFLHCKTDEHLRYNFEVEALVPDRVLAGAAYRSFTGEIKFLEGDHAKKLMDYWINTSESSHTSHVFDSSSVGEISYHDEPNLAARLAEDWHLRIESSELALNLSTEATRYKANSMSSSASAKKHDETPFLEISAPSKEKMEGDAAICRTFGHLVPPSYTGGAKERHFEFAREHLLMQSVDNKQETVYTDRQWLDNMHKKTMPHPVMPKLLLALSTMSTCTAGSKPRLDAERFIKETKTEPLVATLLARSICDATKSPENYLNYCNSKPLTPENHQPHQRLVLRAAQAWHDFEHDSSVYALPGGRLDPEVMLKQAQQLPMGDVT